MRFKYIYDFYLKTLVHFDRKYIYLKILIILFMILYLFYI